MSTLANFPLISQQTPISADGSSPNSEQDCVPTSILAGVMFLKGIHDLSKDWNPDKLLDMAYPEGYTGGTSAKAYIPACQKFGVKLWSLDGENHYLTQQAHKYLAEGKPVVFTIVDPYVPVSRGWTHVCVWFADKPGELTCLDPWPGKPVTKSDAEWESIMRFSQVWILEKEEIVIDLSMPEVAAHYEAFGTTGTQWKCKDNGKVLQGAILDWYRRYYNNAYCGLSYLGLVQSNEIPLQGSKHGAVKVYFECGGVAFYDPAHEFDKRPGLPNDAVYLAHTWNELGLPSFVTDLQKQATQLTATVANLQKQLNTAPNNTALQQELDTANQKLAKIKTDLA